MLFDFDNSELKHAKGEDYTIYGTKYYVEWGIYRNPKNSILPYTVLEEVFVNHERTQTDTNLVKKLSLAYGLIENRNKELRSKEDS